MAVLHVILILYGLASSQVNADRVTNLLLGHFLGIEKREIRRITFTFCRTALPNHADYTFKFPELILPLLDCNMADGHEKSLSSIQALTLSVTTWCLISFIQHSNNWICVFYCQCLPSAG